MSVEALTVRRARYQFESRGRNYSSESQGYATERIVSAIPSVCKKDGASDGLVNSHVIIDTGSTKGYLNLWCTETATEVIALDDA